MRHCQFRRIGRERQPANRGWHLDGAFATVDGAHRGLPSDRPSYAARPRRRNMINPASLPVGEEAFDPALGIARHDAPVVARGDEPRACARRRMKHMIDSVVAAYKLPTTPKPKDIYTDKFLPPVAERMIR